MLTGFLFQLLLNEALRMEEKEILVKVENLSKKFCKDLKTSLWYGVQDLFTNFGGNRNQRFLREQEFWAVKDINFELRRGECLGLIGHNGAGKSTLLKILNGLIKPDAGKVIIKGRVGALIELGAGFNPILTGRENVYNNGAILGFSRKEINEKLDEIIDFAEVREFIDMPVQNYSSGMKVRLGFAVAAQMEPDVLIIDEVLAVGDLGFVLKCFKTIDRVLPKTAIVFVSHSMPMVSRICSQIILMDRGESLFNGRNVAKAIDLYYSRFSNNESTNVFSDGSIELEKINLIGVQEYKNGVSQIKWNDDLEIYFCFRTKKKIEMPRFNISISDKEQRPVAILKPNDINTDLNFSGEKIIFNITHKNLQLAKGVYFLNISVYKINGQSPYLRMNSVISFQINYEEEVWEPFMLDSSFNQKE